MTKYTLEHLYWPHFWQTLPTDEISQVKKYIVDNGIRPWQPCLESKKYTLVGESILHCACAGASDVAVLHMLATTFHSGGGWHARDNELLTPLNYVKLYNQTNAKHTLIAYLQSNHVIEAPLDFYGLSKGAE